MDKNNIYEDTTSDLIEMVKQIRHRFIPVALNTGMLIENIWYNKGELYYFEKDRAKHLIEKGAVTKLNPKYAMPWSLLFEISYKDAVKNVKVRLTSDMNILGVDYWEGEFVYMDGHRATYLQETGFAVIYDEPIVEEQILDTVKEKAIKPRRKRAATKTNNSTSNPSSNSGRFKSSSQD